MTQTPDSMQGKQTYSSSTTRDLLNRLDTMLAEIQAMRQIVQALDEQTADPQHKEQPPRSLADKLHGSLGQGSPEEFDYDIDINFYRFSDEPLD